MTDGPVLWYLNRGSGVVALVLLTAATVLGVLALDGRPGTRLPRFVVQAVHRNVALLAVLTLAAHVATAVLDEFVDIRWWHAVLPFAGGYERIWLGLGAVAVDLLVVVTVTSLLRDRLSRRTWFALHQSTYLLWFTSILHGAGMGTDLAGPQWPVTVACTGAVAAALTWRVARAALRGNTRTTDPATDPVMTMPLRRIP
jgi:sulfoxide reductase heme-binding subunit YedZ